jgi:hypothetical protein
LTATSGALDAAVRLSILALMDRFVPTWRATREPLNRLPARHELWNY